MIYDNFKPVEGTYIPSRSIRLDNSGEPVSILISQNPYILAYCKPKVYLIHSQKLEIVVKLERSIESGLLLEGRYLKSLLCFMGITTEGRVLRIIFDKMGTVYGVEVDETNHKAESVTVSRSGRVFMCEREQVV